MFKSIPKILSLILVATVVNLAIFSAMRIIFFTVFNNVKDPVETSELLNAFYIGLKFDVRLALLISFPILAIGWYKHLNPFLSKWGKGLWISYLIASNTAIWLIYFLDFGFYEYLHTRLNGTFIRFLYNLDTSLQMAWEAYPVVWGMLFLLLYFAAFAFILNKLIGFIEKREMVIFEKNRNITVLLSCSILIFCVGIYGKMATLPLRWSDAFFSNHSFISNLALNPVLHFITTAQKTSESYDIHQVKNHYEMLTEYLGIEEPDKENLNFIRIVDQPKSQYPCKKPNVVIVFMESLAYHKAGIGGNPLKPTPNFDKMAEKSLFFTNFYTPHRKTDRSIFTTISGIPDIGTVESSTRNPLAVRQHTIINAFEGYKKFYMLGGNASWGNIRGVIQHNIEDVKLFEEGMYKAPSNDAWGISDLRLFEEAIDIFRSTNGEPFIALIQTMGNHSPFTIPEDNRGFEISNIELEKILPYGFRSVESFNSMRFMDHALGNFLSKVEQEEFFKNTIFVFYGDHGKRAHNIEHLRKSERDLKLCHYHVPLVIYAPHIIRESQVIHKVVSEVDILPTVATLAGIPYINSTIGRDILDPRYDNSRYAFTLDYNTLDIGIIGSEYYFVVNADGSNERLHLLDSENPRENVLKKFPEVSQKYNELCRGIYETSCYMRYFNSPSAVNKKVEKLKQKHIAEH